MTTDPLYNDLCRPATTPIILALMVLPEGKEDWLHWSIDELLLKGTMYWKSFESMNTSDNNSTVTVKISKNNVINPDTLNGMLRGIAKEETL